MTQKLLLVTAFPRRLLMRDSNQANGPRQQQGQAELEYIENVMLMWPHDCSEMDGELTTIGTGGWHGWHLAITEFWFRSAFGRKRMGLRFQAMMASQRRQAETPKKVPSGARNLGVLS